ncbi:MAG: type II secretion system F family protein [Rhodoglobus sp.]|nr:type II secretion system F family protein [Rhodoglobus sp.]
MTIAMLLGLTLGAGVTLVLSVRMWPRRNVERRSNRVLAMAQERIVQAGLERVNLGLVVGVASALAVAAGATTFAITRVLAFAVAAAVVGAALVPMAIVGRARSRRRAARVVWPDVVDQLVSAVRSGRSLAEAVVTLSNIGPEVTRAAFVGFESTYRSTGNFGLSLDELKVHLADPVADRIIETLRMSREVGGSELTTVLRNLGSYLREESAIRSEVEARQSWLLNAARLGVAAPWVVLALLATRPEAASAYNTAAGAILIVGGLAISAIAYRLMIALGRLPEGRRFFA